MDSTGWTVQLLLVAVCLSQATALSKLF